MTLALVAAALGTLGLMRWPGVHWALAEAYAAAGPEARGTLGAVFLGLHLYLGNYIGEFLGEFCLGAFFLLTALLFLVGALRNAVPAVQPVADVNNALLPLWMIALGATLLWSSRRAAPGFDA